MSDQLEKRMADTLEWLRFQVEVRYGDKVKRVPCDEPDCDSVYCFIASQLRSVAALSESRERWRVLAVHLSGCPMCGLNATTRTLPVTETRCEIGTRLRAAAEGESK